MIKTLTDPDCYEARTIKDNLLLVAWVFAWMATLIVSDKAALYGWWSAEWMTVLSIAVNALMGLMVVRAFVKMLRKADELHRRIQLNALAVAMGVSLLGAVTYSLLVTWGYIVDEEVTDIIVLMCVSYSVAGFWGVLRYR